MNIEVKILKGLPTRQIEKFEDRVVYYAASTTREYVKGSNSYPYLTGRLARSEIATPIVGRNKEYVLTSGVDYAKYVWKMKNANWTNPSTKPQWYYTTFKEKGTLLLTNAILKAKKEI